MEQIVLGFFAIDNIFNFVYEFSLIIYSVRQRELTLKSCWYVRISTLQGRIVCEWTMPSNRVNDKTRSLHTTIQSSNAWALCYAFFSRMHSAAATTLLSNSFIVREKYWFSFFRFHKCEKNIPCQKDASVCDQIYAVTLKSPF